jgi:hypothetical protein
MLMTQVHVRPSVVPVGCLVIKLRLPITSHWKECLSLPVRLQVPYFDFDNFQGIFFGFWVFHDEVIATPFLLRHLVKFVCGLLAMSV